MKEKSYKCTMDIDCYNKIPLKTILKCNNQHLIISICLI